MNACFDTRDAMTAVFDVSDFLHPLDLAARQHLEGIPLLQVAVKRYLGSVTDRRDRQWLLASAVRLGPRQLPDIYRMLPPICDAFGIKEPELFLMRGEANAITMGHSRPAILIFNQLLEDLAEDEIQAVLAHECGHILAEHILYRQMARALTRAGQAGGVLGSGLMKAATSVATSQLQAALINWYRKSELTADRAAAGYLRDAQPMQRALFHLCGLPAYAPADVSYTAFLEQAEEFDQVADSSWWNRYLSRGVEKSGMTHPIPALRVREVTVWTQSDNFRQLVGIAELGHSEERLRCAQCGQEVATAWRFCQRCGGPVPQEVVSQTGVES
jgi:Zn-dependent protease with chaperone function